MEAGDFGGKATERGGYCVEFNLSDLRWGALFPWILMDHIV